MSEEKYPQRLLFSREQVAELLGGIHVATIIRMQRAGRLTPVRLTGKARGQVFYRAAEVLALAAGQSDAR